MPESPEHWNPQHAGRLAALIDIVEAAGQHTLGYFRRADLAVDAKQDKSPVTIADREAESLVRRMISDHFAEDTVHGEEFDDQAGTSRYRWIVDPIDGTKSFICGVPLYSTLLALEVDEQPLAGAIYIPALDELMVATTGLGCWYRPNASATWQRAAVSKRNQISDAVFVTSQVDLFDQRGAGEAYKRLEREAWITRSWGDGYGYLLVATGRADLMVDPICNPWDVAAILPCVVEAGGQFTDWEGNPTTRGGDGVGTNRLLHSDVLARLQGDGPRNS